MQTKLAKAEAREVELVAEVSRLSTQRASTHTTLQAEQLASDDAHRRLEMAEQTDAGARILSVLRARLVGRLANWRVAAAHMRTDDPTDGNGGAQLRALARAQHTAWAQQARGALGSWARSTALVAGAKAAGTRGVKADESALLLAGQASEFAQKRAADAARAAPLVALRTLARLMRGERKQRTALCTWSRAACALSLKGLMQEAERREFEMQQKKRVGGGEGSGGGC